MSSKMTYRRYRTFRDAHLPEYDMEEKCRASGQRCSYLVAMLALVSACTAANNPQLIRGRCVVVTGGSRGFGVEIARAFAREAPASICLVARSAAALESTCESLAAEHPGVEFHPIVADITSGVDRSLIVDTVQQLRAVGGWQQLRERRRRRHA